jgi:hypothetical protein
MPSYNHALYDLRVFYYTELMMVDMPLFRNDVELMPVHNKSLELVQRSIFSPSFLGAVLRVLWNGRNRKIFRADESSQPKCGRSSYALVISHLLHCQVAVSRIKC